MDIPYHELLLDAFKIFCTYRFYNSHSKAMALRKEELKNTLVKKAMNSEFKHIIDDEEDDIFVN